MRAPSTQTRILAFAPIQLCAWASALFFGYHYFHGAPVFWPVVITVAFLLNVIRAHEQVQAYKIWLREWDAMSGIPPRPTRWPRLVGLALVGVPLTFLFYDVGQHGGASSLLGVVLLFIIPLLVIGLVLKLIQRVMRRKAAKVMPVTVCVSRSLQPAPSLNAAYGNLPPYCRELLGKQS